MRRRLLTALLPALAVTAGLVALLLLGDRERVDHPERLASGASHATGAGAVANSPADPGLFPRRVETPPERAFPSGVPAAPSITGTVLVLASPDATPSPLAGEEITVEVVQGARHITRRVRTGPAGDFRIDGLLHGEQRAIFSHPGCRQAEIELSLAAGTALRRIEVVLERGLRVWGRVRDLEERPAPDALLLWTALKATGDGETLEVIAGRDGSWETHALEPGRYRVQVLPRLLRAAWGGAPARHVTVRGDVENRLDFTADLGRPLAVRVLSPGGAAIPGAQVRFELETPARGVSGYLPPTDAAGRTHLHGLPAAGKLTLEAPGAPAGEPENESPSPARTVLDLADLPAEATVSPGGRPRSP